MLAALDDEAAPVLVRGGRVCGGGAVWPLLMFSMSRRISFIFSSKESTRLFVLLILSSTTAAWLLRAPTFMEMSWIFVSTWAPT